MWGRLLRRHLTEEQELLLDALCDAHWQAAMTNANLSSEVIKATSSVGQSFSEAICAGMLTLGNVHGPIVQARRLFFRESDEEILDRIARGEMIPGFGNSFYKDGPDPALNVIIPFVQKHYPEQYARVVRIADMIESEKGKKLFLNPAAFSAITAEVLDLAEGTELMLVFLMRMPVWAKQYADAR